MIVYKYLTFENGILAIRDKTLVFSRTSTYNDPFEGKAIFKNHTHIDGTTEILLDMYERALCSCFSQTPSSILMWSHYGDQHAGIVIGFDTDQFFNYDPQPLILEDFSAITYTSSPPAIQLDNNRITRASICDAYFTKAEIWSYEEEVRTFIIKQNDTCTFLDAGDLSEKYLVKFNKSSIREIYTGARCDKFDTTKFKDELIKNGYNIQIRSFALSDKHYTLEPAKPKFLWSANMP